MLGSYFTNDKNDFFISQCISVSIQLGSIERYTKILKSFVFQIQKKLKFVRMTVFIKFYEDQIRAEIEKNIDQLEKDFNQLFQSANTIQAYGEAGFLIRNDVFSNRVFDRFY